MQSVCIFRLNVVEIQHFCFQLFMAAATKYGQIRHFCSQIIRLPPAEPCPIQHCCSQGIRLLTEKSSDVQRCCSQIFDFYLKNMVRFNIVIPKFWGSLRQIPVAFNTVAFCSYRYLTKNMVWFYIVFKRLQASYWNIQIDLTYLFSKFCAFY